MNRLNLAIWPQSTVFRKLLAWSAHLFTASGVVWGFLAILAIQNQQWKVAFIWMAVAVIVDGFDGELARRLRVQEYARGLDGALLDNIIDYLNYVIVPALFLYEAQLLPEQFLLFGPLLILLASAYQFCQVDAKTADHSFKGFPSYWNMVVIYLFLFDSHPWMNLVVIVFLSVLVFVPVKYLYPSRTRRFRKTSLLLSYAWGLLGVAILVLYPAVPAWLLWLSLLYVAYYAGVSLLISVRH